MTKRPAFQGRHLSDDMNKMKNKAQLAFIAQVKTIVW